MKKLDFMYSLAFLTLTTTDRRVVFPVQIID